MRRGNAGLTGALTGMDIRNEARPDVTTPDRKVGWGRLGLATVLGLVAGTVLFPRPAMGRRSVRQGSGEEADRTVRRSPRG